MNAFTDYGDSKGLATREDVLRTERLIGKRLPSALVDCLKGVRNGGEVMPNQLDEDGMAGVTNFLGVSPDDDANSISARFLEMKSRLPEWFTPIADCEGGNLLGMDAAGGIFFWHHELNADPRILPVADSLAELDGLVRTPEVPEGVLGTVEWVDPAFEVTLRTLREKG